MFDKMPCNISGCISITFKNMSFSGFGIFRRNFFVGNAEKSKTEKIKIDPDA